MVCSVYWEPDIDQKGYKIGACAPFMALLDRFVSQEETVEVRLHFKQLIRHQLDLLQAFALEDPDRYKTLVEAYNGRSREIDYGSLKGLITI